MRWHPSSKLRAVVLLVGAGIVGSLALARPEPVILAAPFAVVMLAALALARPPTVRCSSWSETGQAVEGDVVMLQVRVVVEEALSSVEVSVVLPRGLSAPQGERTFGTAMAAGEERTVTVGVRCERWGNHRFGEVRLRVTGPLGLLVAEQRIEPHLELQVVPSLQNLRRLVRPKEPRATAGSQLAAITAAGLEFSDLRPFVPGDRARDVNWRATARRGSLQVNQQHPDRSTDVVLLVDAFSEATLSDAIGAASAFTTAYLRYRDRVGLVSVGGSLRWLRPGAGLRQQYVLVKRLLDTRVIENVADKDLDQIPPQVLPRNAMVLALSPLQDERFQRLIVDLRARGIDVVTIEVSPVPYVAASAGDAGALAHRLWRLQRDATRARLRELGIPVVVWRNDEPLAGAIEEVAAWPRVAHSVR